MKINQIIMLCCVFLLSACGSGSSQAVGDGAGDGTLIAERVVPGGSMALHALDTIAGGETVRFHLHLKHLPDPERVTVYVSDSYSSEDATMEAQLLLDGIWELELALPLQLSKQDVVWVRLHFSDGSIIESGSSDFLLQ